MFTNPITGKKHRTWKNLHNAIRKSLPRNWWTRSAYDEIAFSIPGYLGGYHHVSQRDIINLFRPALEQEYCNVDKKHRGTALNHDLYGYDPDQGVAVIQARQAICSKYGTSTRKTYFLVGRNEITGQFFRHPVGAHAVRAAINVNPDPAATVQAVQRWMWEVTPKQLAASIRQGDVLMVPERVVPMTEPVGTTLIVAESHMITAAQIKTNGRIYCLDPTVVHAKGQHAPVAARGWFSIRVAREADAWDFAERIGD
jgi:hypothetical protein